MDIREAREGDVVVLSPDGSLAGTEETSALESKLALVQAAGARFLVIDCTSVGQLASVAIRALLVASRKLGRSRGRLVLYGVNAKVRKAFAISGFDKDFTLLQTREEALERVLEPVAPVARPVGRGRSAPITTADQPAPALREPLVPAAEAPTGAAKASARAAAPGPPAAEPGAPGAEAAAAVPAAPPPAVDDRGALADALLAALGARVVRAPAPPGATASSKELEAAAEAVLAALGAGR
jgi:anti-anti-sigma factor